MIVHQQQYLMDAAKSVRRKLEHQATLINSYQLISLNDKFWLNLLAWKF